MALSAGHAALTTLEISSAVTEFKGSSSIITSGADNNLAPTGAGAGSTAEFNMQLVGVPGPTAAVMRVTYNGTTSGSLDTSLNSGFMIARTVNSQGLTDQGTLSILLKFNGGTNPRAASFTFNFLDATGTVPLPAEVRITSLDIDFLQFNTFNNSEMNTAGAVVGSNVSSSTLGGTTTYFDPTPATNSVVNNPNSAVTIDTTGSSFEVDLGTSDAGTTYALYMIEFRDRSQVIPEPSAALLGGLGVLALLRRRRVA
jgi:hypothetical protein